MELNPFAPTVATPHEIVEKIDQKALRLSALLREITTHPVSLESRLIDQLDVVLEMLECRVAATRALLRVSAQSNGEMAPTA